MRNLAIKIPPLRKANSALFHYRANRWRWNKSFLENVDDVSLRAPVYLLGTQGGGLTLLSRILHRHPDAISVSSHHRHWAGEDETQNALAPILPEDFGWRRIDLAGYPVEQHDWLYANDDFLPYYRRRGTDADPAAAARYRALLKAVVRQNGLPGHPAPRFIDKSQSLTVRVGFLQAALEDCDPRFVLISRNPYAGVWREASRAGVMRRLNRSIEDRVRIAAQHWRNSFEAAGADADADPQIKLAHWRFEDMLAEPERVIGEICAHAGLAPDLGILPGPDDVFPVGSAVNAFNRQKWYPLRTDVNDRYLAELPNWARAMITEICGPLAERFGYVA